MVLKLNDTLRNIIETITLFIALSFVIPVPSSTSEPYDLLPGAGYAFFFFAISRHLSIRPVGWAYLRFLIELVLFAAFLVINYKAVNM